MEHHFISRSGKQPRQAAEGRIGGGRMEELLLHRTDGQKGADEAGDAAISGKADAFRAAAESAAAESGGQRISPLSAIQADPSKPETAALQVERLLQFAQQAELIEGPDLIPARNALLDLLKLPEPFTGDVPQERLETPVAALEPLLDYAAATRLLPENTTTCRDLFDARIMGLLMPRQSEVARTFWRTAKEQGVQQATDDFYRLSRSSNYIQTARIRKNRYWRAKTDYGDLEITINLSKPEKDPKEIAAERSAPQVGYPKCLLCLENVGYAGRINHPGRQNHRVIPMTLQGRPWHLQYSPYVYYNEHCIVFDEQHVPMKTTADTFERLLEFVALFPHYFIGSNADLPIVGGSILSHDHYQGGRHDFAMALAPVEAAFTHAAYPGVRAGIVKWPMSVVRLSGRDAGELLRLASALLADWREYSDSSVGIMAYSEQEGGGRTPHNTITPIARSGADGEWQLDLVLRNNRQSAEHPDGIFHPHRELHHIKKENIGLIEVMGLAVLPGRLTLELEQIRAVLTGQGEPLANILANAEHPLHKHAAWMEELQPQFTADMPDQAAAELLQQAVGRKFLQVLLDAGVYKRDAAGQAAFAAWMKQAGFEQV
ncbi:UDP-glucose--hexose-1-phosphate uridylyltransferase [Paenibacillus sp. y28]|uniref:UDP-glucose--hexose-1-phosphate uridylyltransferase n=1 Tax=Paenibacillus sp. y28 TaxID=3129110 RepID=UPI003018AC85